MRITREGNHIKAIDENGGYVTDTLAVPHILYNILQELKALNMKSQLSSASEHSIAREWVVGQRGRVILNVLDFKHDIKLTLDGDFESDEARENFAHVIANKLSR